MKLIQEVMEVVDVHEVSTETWWSDHFPICLLKINKPFRVKDGLFILALFPDGL